MSIEDTKPEETAPVAQKTEQPTETPLINETPSVAQPTDTLSATPAVDATPAVESKKDEAVVEAVPASEGVLGYKAPGFLKQFHYSKHHFWFSDEPVAAEHLHTVREKHSNEHAAWARETGQGALFFTKRAEDKEHPSGMILLHEASEVTKDGFGGFQFKIGTHIHRFEAASTKERDSWLVALEKKVEEAKSMKDEITGRDTYKKNMKDYTKPALVSTGAATAVKKDRSKSNEPKKSLDAKTTTAAATGPVETKPEETVAPAPVEEKKVKSEKERSQSRKRSSVFGSFLNKKDDQKTEEKKEDKAEKQLVKEEKKAEAEQKKEEAKATHEPSKAIEATEALAVAAVPAAVVSHDKKEDKEVEKSGAVTPTDKKNKRGSVFGSLFGKKNATSPTTEKTEAETVTPAADTEVLPVAETAPKIDEPIDTKPIDTAAVVAPVTNAAQPTTSDVAKDTTTSPATETPAQTEKKSNFFSGLIKKVEGKKDESKEEKAVETSENTPPVAETTDGTAEAKPERPGREKRRTSLFGNLGTLKKKTETNHETKSEDVNGTTETKREKSPLPTKIGGLFRRPSKAVKSEPVKDTTEPTVDAAHNTTAPAVGEPKPTTIENTESNIIGDVVPEAVHAPVAPEVKASA